MYTSINQIFHLNVIQLFQLYDLATTYVHTYVHKLFLCMDVLHLYVRTYMQMYVSLFSLACHTRSNNRISSVL